MSSEDKTKEVLENLLSDLYQKQALSLRPDGSCFLKGKDGQLLGTVTTNRYDSRSILNKYGPFGSPYSGTSIFNKYSQYGSPYGQYSIHNPHTTTPPELYINNSFYGHVSRNPRMPKLIPTDSFLYTLHHDINALCEGRILRDETAARCAAGESFIQASDGTYLGSLNPNRFDQNSIFNQYGPYGNPYVTTSIFNRFGPYGGQFSPLSPFNPFNSDPPRIYIQGQLVAYLTVNQLIPNRVEPDNLYEWVSQRIGRY